MKMTQRKQQSVLSAILGMMLNIFLFVIKLLGGLWVGSVAMVNDGFNHLADTGSNVILLFSSIIGSRQADDDHPFGHGRAEYIASLVIGLSIIALSANLFLNSLEAIQTSDYPRFEWLNVALLVGSILIKLGMFFYYQKLFRTWNSLPHRAVAFDALNDAIVTGVVLSTMLISNPTLHFDAIGGIVVAAFIFYNGLIVSLEATQMLMGQAKDHPLIATIREEVLNHKGILGVHDIAFHDYGPLNQVMTFHVEVLDRTSLLESHAIVDELEAYLEKHYPVELVIHVDPISSDAIKVQKWTKEMQSLTSKIDSQVTIEALRLVDLEEKPELILHLKAAHLKPNAWLKFKKTFASEVDQHHHFFRVFLER